MEAEGYDNPNSNVDPVEEEDDANPLSYVEPTTDNMAARMEPRPGRFLVSYGLVWCHECPQPTNIYPSFHVHTCFIIEVILAFTMSNGTCNTSTLTLLLICI